MRHEFTQEERVRGARAGQAKLAAKGTRHKFTPEETARGIEAAAAKKRAQTAARRGETGDVQ